MLGVCYFVILIRACASTQWDDVYPLNKAEVSREYTREKKETKKKKSGRKGKDFCRLERGREQIFSESAYNAFLVRNWNCRVRAVAVRGCIQCVLALQYSLRESGLSMHTAHRYGGMSRPLSPEATSLIVWARPPLFSGSCADSEKLSRAWRRTRRSAPSLHKNTGTTCPHTWSKH